MEMLIPSGYRCLRASSSLNEKGAHYLLTLCLISGLTTGWKCSLLHKAVLTALCHHVPKYLLDVSAKMFAALDMALTGVSIWSLHAALDSPCVPVL